MRDLICLTESLFMDAGEIVCEIVVYGEGAKEVRKSIPRAEILGMIDDVRQEPICNSEEEYDTLSDNIILALRETDDTLTMQFLYALLYFADCDFQIVWERIEKFRVELQADNNIDFEWKRMRPNG